MRKTTPQRSSSLKRNNATNSSRLLRPRRNQIELLEPRHLLTTFTPVLIPSPFTHSSNPTSLLTIGNITYFAADDGVHGNELWKTDGTAAGTTLVKDINPGSSSSLFDSEFVNINGTLFFAADDGTHGTELWKSDGTAAGTMLVADLGSNSSYQGSIPTQLTNFNGTLLFVAYDFANSFNTRELWKSDGTAAGTTIIGPQPNTPLVNLNETIFFGSGGSLWETDGTATGTFAIANAHASSLINVNGTLFFTSPDLYQGTELWKSDGTAAGTVMVTDIGPQVYNQVDFRTQDLVNVDGTLFFTANDGIHGYELWKSDGTAAGTVMVKDIFPGTTNYYGYPLTSSNPSYLTDFNGTLFFTANDGSNGNEIWKSDGTAAGTVMVKDINPATGFYNDGYPQRGDSNPRNLADVDGTLYFSATDGTNGNELWKSDGTADGTVMVRDIFTGSNYYKPTQYSFGFFGNSSSPANFTTANGKILFTATDGVHGVELWRTDGTAEGTVMVEDLNKDNTIVDAAYMTNVDGTLYFAAQDPSTIARYNPDGFSALWKTDGTAADTVLLKDFSGGLSSFTNVNGTLFFTARDGNSVGLWKTDGTVTGTVPVKIDSGDNFYPSERSLTAVGGTLFFTIYDSTIHSEQLWKSDGTPGGTLQLTDANLGIGGSYSDDLVNANGTLFFVANDGTHGEELWKTDGTVAGTVMVKDINAIARRYTTYTYEYVDGYGCIATRSYTYGDSTPGSSPTNLTNVKGTLFFTADDGMHGEELWKSDGTADGTVMVKDINPNVTSQHGYTYPQSSYPKNLTDVDGKLYFFADDGTHGQELWKSDGTNAGTTKVADLSPGSTNRYSYPFGMTDVNGTLFLFQPTSTRNQFNLWKSDGTSPGTVIVSTLSADPFPDESTNVDGTLYFFTDGNTEGTQLWKSDGTTAGTLQVAQFPLSYLSGIENDFMLSVNDELFFTASSVQYGTQFYYLAPQLIPGDFNGDGHVDTADIGPAMQALTNPSAYETQYGVSAADLQTIGDVNGKGVFNNADLQRLLILLKGGGESLSSVDIGSASGSIIAENQSGVISSTDTKQVNSTSPAISTVNASPPSDNSQTGIPSVANQAFFTVVEQILPSATVSMSPAATDSISVQFSLQNNTALLAANHLFVPTTLPGNETVARITLLESLHEIMIVGVGETQGTNDRSATEISTSYSISQNIISSWLGHLSPSAIDQIFLAPELDHSHRLRWHSEKPNDERDFADESLASLFAQWSQWQA